MKDRIKNWLKQTNTSREVLAKELGVSMGTLKNWLSTRDIPELAQRAIEDILKLDGLPRKLTMAQEQGLVMEAPRPVVKIADHVVRPKPVYRPEDYMGAHELVEWAAQLQGKTVEEYIEWCEQIRPIAEDIYRRRAAGENIPQFAVNIGGVVMEIPPIGGCPLARKGQP